ncbi:MAG: AAA family ATPase [Eubacterium sp.]|nr:AAA family ATPase [Eubacterium sp.]
MSKRFLALGYITGILPIKKFQGESAMNNFTEYTMISPKQLAPYFGFTDDEVKDICDKEPALDINEVRRWYDGYKMNYITPTKARKIIHMYNPNSLVDAYIYGGCDSYWKNTGAFAGLNDYIAMNMDGMKETIIEMLTGSECPVDISSYQNDLTSFKSKDDIMTAMIHMGYLGYNPETKCAYIPNEEVRDVFESAIKVGNWSDIIDALRKSDALLEATWNGDCEKVAEMVAESHQDYTSILEYHDENSLALAIMMSYYTARKHYTII